MFVIVPTVTSIVFPVRPPRSQNFQLVGKTCPRCTSRWYSLQLFRASHLSELSIISMQSWMYIKMASRWRFTLVMFLFSLTIYSFDVHIHENTNALSTTWQKVIEWSSSLMASISNTFLFRKGPLLTVCRDKLIGGWEVSHPDRSTVPSAQSKLVADEKTSLQIDTKSS